ncbi:hydroxyisourate hydrolase [Glaciihabitans sp. INWT7]|uniref:hydroxyisourate hydrolase n=1 Tax=Glaciihabitans sp. INWT7 TaxID=2596912 RepID=UPI0016292214|nr:hydroxyisourate hydrolase [Glaciihabitans sp. INWT7]QNE46076.1 hydroxyisourate hydrolase [Glaciihabitans sp. INWT7]
MSHVTTHVLDTATGRPAVDVSVTLSTAEGSAIATGSTDTDGRISALGPDALPPGHYRLAFDTGAWFGEAPHFFPVVTIDFILGSAAHLHVPLLLSPFAYSTYRGS